MATNEPKRRIREVMAPTECRAYFADGSIVRLGVRLDMSGGFPVFVTTEGFDRAGVLDRIEWYSADGKLAFTQPMGGFCVLPGHPGAMLGCQTGAV